MPQDQKNKFSKRERERERENVRDSGYVHVCERGSYLE